MPRGRDLTWGEIEAQRMSMRGGRLFDGRYPFHPRVYAAWVHEERPDLCARLYGVDHDVLWELCTRCNWQTGENAYPSHENIAIRTHRTEPAIRDSLRRLRRLGLVRERADKRQTGKGQLVAAYDVLRPGQGGEERGKESFPPSDAGKGEAEGGGGGKSGCEGGKEPCPNLESGSSSVNMNPNSSTAVAAADFIHSLPNLSSEDAEVLLKKHGARAVMSVKALLSRRDRDGRSVSNPAGFVRRALQEGWADQQDPGGALEEWREFAIANKGALAGFGRLDVNKKGRIFIEPMTGYENQYLDTVEDCESLLGHLPGAPSGEAEKR